jgi:hypothetical protein
MPNLTDTLQASQNSQLLTRVTSGLQKVATAILAEAEPDANELAWVRRAWFTVGETPKLQWYAARMLEYAAHQNEAFRAAIDANKDDPQVSDEGIVVFAMQYVQICVTLNI